MAGDRYFLGGKDLEMAEIKALLAEAGRGDRVVDRGLAWGARATDYGDDIRAAIAADETPVLVELEDDLPADMDRGRLVIVDHHGERAGADRPSALRQIFDRVGGLRWTRRRALVEANDIGHAPALRAIGASAATIRRIRGADRRAQGVTPAVEAESRRAIAKAERRGRLLVVRTRAPTSSAVTDFLLPEYGGRGGDDVLVLMPDKIAFFGRGDVVTTLSARLGSWSGGALPDRGYWGAEIATAEAEALIGRVSALVNANGGGQEARR